MSRIDDGFKTIVTFSAGSSGVTFTFYEKEITPPGVEGGGPNDTTTMRNTEWRTLSPKQLKTLTPMTAIGAYDPAVYDEIIAMLQTNQSIVVTFPDDSTLTFFGWIDGFVPGNIVEGEQPTATITIQPSNQDADGEEIAPVYAA